MVTNSNNAVCGLKEVISYIHAYDKIEGNYEGLISEMISAIDKN